MPSGQIKQPVALQEKFLDPLPPNNPVQIINAGKHDIDIRSLHSPSPGFQSRDIRNGSIGIAVMAGSTALSAPVAVDVLCAAGALSDSVQPAAILTTASSPRWLDRPGTQRVYYGQDIPFIQLRPGRSLQIKEAERVALQ